MPAWGRLFKFVSGLAFSSKLCPGYDASILDQLPVWPSVPRRSDACHPGMAMGLGDPLRLTSVNSATTGHLSARGLWPADIQQWPFGNRAFFWSAHDASFSANGWSARPKMAVAGLAPALLPRKISELVIGSPNSFAPAAQIQSFLIASGEDTRDDTRDGQRN